LAVDPTITARKGTSWTAVRPVLMGADEGWGKSRVVHGLSSGEGLIAAVGDAVTDGEGKVISAGAADKRLLVVEEEFSRVLDVRKREASTLAAVLRLAWDGAPLAVLTKNAMKATGAHISVLGHITVEELRKGLTETDKANGLANRFLFVCARRPHLLPSGGNLDDQVVFELAANTRKALEIARSLGTMRRSTAAEARWAEMYAKMAEDEPGGLLGALVARPEPQTLRLSVAYAALDGARVIDVEHLEAAYALWRYCRASARYIFRDALGDEIADKLEAAIRAAGPAGLDAAGQHDTFGRHLDAKRLELARGELERAGRIVTASEETGGRPRLVSRSTRLVP